MQSRSFYLITLLILLSTQTCFAVGSTAFRLEVPDAEAVAKGNAFVAEADNPSAVYYNPAGMTQLKGVPTSSMGLSVLQPFTDYETPAGGEVHMRRNTFFVPASFFVHDFGLDRFVFGFGTYSSWGTGTDWAPDSFSRYVATESILETIDTTLAVAYEVTDNFSLGVGFDYDYSKVSKSKKLSQGAGADGGYQIKGKADGWGYRIGALYKINDKHQIGLQYRSEIDLKYQGKLYADNLNSSGINYQAIFGGTSYEVDISAPFTLPQSVVLGYSYRPNEDWIINFDIEWMDWASNESEIINYIGETDLTRLAVLNDGNPAVRDWNSTFSYGLGAEYGMYDWLRLRSGYTFKETSTPNESFTTSQPDFNVYGVSFGTGIDLNPTTVLDLSYTGWFAQRKVDTTIPDSVGKSIDIDGKYSTYFNVFLASLVYEFF